MFDMQYNMLHKGIYTTLHHVDLVICHFLIPCARCTGLLLLPLCALCFLCPGACVAT